MSDQNHTTVSRLRKTTKTIQGLLIPRTFKRAIANGFKPTGHETETVSVRGDVETLKGTATFEEHGLPWLACPVVVTMKYDWAKLRATRKTAVLSI